jgi:membrane protein involved in colicin uptake
MSSYEMFRYQRVREEAAAELERLAKQEAAEAAGSFGEEMARIAQEAQRKQAGAVKQAEATAQEKAEAAAILYWEEVLKPTIAEYAAAGYESIGGGRMTNQEWERISIPATACVETVVRLANENGIATRPEDERYVQPAYEDGSGVGSPSKVSTIVRVYWGRARQELYRQEKMAVRSWR